MPIKIITLSRNIRKLLFILVKNIIYISKIIIILLILENYLSIIFLKGQIYYFLSMN